jgi:hypothetical protein
MSDEKKPLNAAKRPTLPATIELDPKPVKLVKQTDADTPPKPVKAVASPVPRLIHQNERAPEGLKRFACSYKARKTPTHVKRYVLARDVAEAEAYYLKSMGLDRQTIAADETAKMAIRELPD